MVDVPVPPEIQTFADAFSARLKALLDKAYAEIAAMHLETMKKVTVILPPGQTGGAAPPKA